MAGPDRETLAALFDREPAEAVAWLESKGLRVTWNWAEMLDEAHARAFTVAKATRIDVLSDIRRAVIDATREGKTLRQFRDELEPVLQEKGWWGKQVVVDSSGGAEMVQLGSPRRLKTIYQTNVQSVYMAGRAQAQQAADAFPYLQYVAVMDSRTRPTHAALDGQVFAKDDPIWDTHTPPNGFNCRCRTRPLTASQVEREGLDVRSSRGQTVTRTVDAGTDRRSGELFRTQQTGIRVTGSDGKPTVMWADPGFNSNPLAGHWMDNVLAQKAVDALGGEAGFASVARAVTSPTRMKAWSSFVDNTFEFDRIQGQTMTLGILPLEVVRRLSQEGKSVAPVIHAEDRLIIGKKARRHQEKGDALTREEWAALPAAMGEAQWFSDSETGNVIGQLPDGKHVMVGPDGAVDSAYRDADADRKIKSGRWRPL
ncbi:phage head morphogenesis protein [Pseudazoarcus pumilus]|uniref:Phage head morphogenesis protein n=1 Tax=Pseudazoarcus pumilus TaxID=2067960 RepID=A0A2I6S9E2_9RHOO|nr:phage minor head protein [Pseudazoarcus pumilus]AUN95883.1 phage head morphogenesis protein [Pseudazoarcus pumilus]